MTEEQSGEFHPRIACRSNNTDSHLTLRVLRSFTGTAAAVFFTFDDTGITGEKTGTLQGTSVVRAYLEKGLRNGSLQGIGLAGRTTADEISADIKLSHRSCDIKRLKSHITKGLAAEV